MNPRDQDQFLEKLKKNSFKLISKIISLIKAKEYSKIAIIVNKKLISVKGIVNSPRDSKFAPEYASFALIFGIFFKGLEEFSTVCEICDNPEWIATPEAVEQVWFLLQNCKERVGFALKRISVNVKVIEYIVERVNQIEAEISERYGKGLYVSPEVVIEECTCSICGLDYRKCEHIGNQVYGGKLCLMQPTKIKPGACVVLLEEPADKRCRIWPWSKVDDGQGVVFQNVPLIISFRVDDFLYK